MLDRLVPSVTAARSQRRPSRSAWAVNGVTVPVYLGQNRPGQLDCSILKTIKGGNRCIKRRCIGRRCNGKTLYLYCTTRPLLPHSVFAWHTLLLGRWYEFLCTLLCIKFLFCHLSAATLLLGCCSCNWLISRAALHIQKLKRRFFVFHETQ